ncbi:MAG: hypothetical protein AB1716_07670, partial [Planctomycetota bacterium]
MIRTTLLVGILASIATAAACGAPPDALDDTLALVGLRRGDLGWRPKAWWPRWPTAEYKLRAFDALFAEPLDTLAYTRTLAEAAWEKLDPAQLDQKTPSTDGNLFQAVQRLGLDAKFGGFRGYHTNLLAADTPLDEAIVRLMQTAGRATEGYTFGMKLPYPQPRAALAERLKVLPEGVSPILGRLVLNIVEAQRWAELAFRKVDAADRLTVATRLNIGEEMIDAVDYCPAVDDVARAWDEASMWYAAQKCVQALDDARVALQQVGREREWPEFACDWETPWGWIRVRGGGRDEVEGHDALLIVDLGGDDTYTGPVAASAAGLPISLLLDLGGADTYTSDQGRPAQGAGLCGVGILIDTAGADRYTAERYAQGVGQFGFGLLADLGGDDEYFCKFSGQACGYFGVGLLFDVAGDDKYKLYAEGQGLGGVGGVGVLADRAGDDRYT